MPVILEDSSALTGAGWHGRSVYNICTSVNNAPGTKESRMFACIVLDEADKLFKANKANHNGAADCGFLPISNLLTFVAGGIVEDPESHCSMDTSNFMVICLGAFEGLDEIVRKRTAGRRIGFCAGVHEEQDEAGILEHVTDADLLEYGVPVEFLSRLSLITRTRKLGRDDFVRIIKHSDESPIRMYNNLLSKTSNIRVSITDAAVGHIASKAAEEKEGARMLARLVTETLQPAIFNIGEDPDIDGIEIDCGENGLFTRSVYNVCQGWQARTAECPF